MAVLKVETDIIASISGSPSISDTSNNVCRDLQNWPCFYQWSQTDVCFYTPVSRWAVLCDWVWWAGGRPHRFPLNNSSSVYQIFTKLGHMIPLWKGKNPIYFGVKGQGHRYYK